MRTPFLAIASFSALTTVALGAFGAHGLKQWLSVDQLAIYKTAVMYQMWHSLALALIAILIEFAYQNKALHWAGWLMCGGIILFSGSLYFLTLFHLQWLGMITPIGGCAWLMAWGLITKFAFETRHLPIFPSDHC